jgi:hypothetical protein
MFGKRVDLQTLLFFWSTEVLARNTAAILAEKKSPHAAGSMNIAGSNGEGSLRPETAA